MARSLLHLLPWLLWPLRPTVGALGTSARNNHPYHMTHSESPRRSSRRLADDTPAALAWPQKPMGDRACPCLTRDQIIGRGPNQNQTRSDPTDSAMYGLGCAAHSPHYDPQCRQLQHTNTTTLPSEDDPCLGILPRPVECQLQDDSLIETGCHRFWCWVDPQNCTLPYGRFERTTTAVRVDDNATTGNLQEREPYYASYATCGHLDPDATRTQRAHDLMGRRLKLGLNSNTGGWMGAYNPEGSFAINNDWRGPMVDFVTDAARTGNFSLVQTPPPEWLVNESAALWGPSSFNLCVYAVALGYLDLCVSDLTITPERAAATSFFELDSAPIYLLTFLETDSSSAWDQFVQEVFKIYQPFDRSSWLFIFLFCIPSLGVLMLFHEYDSPGTAFSETKEYRVIGAGSGGEAGGSPKGPPKIETRNNPMWKQSVKAIYISFLAFFIRSYRVRVFSAGGKLQLLAIACFILLTTTVYTANLAAQFVQEALKTPVASLEEALQRGFNFCSERKAGSIVMNLFGIDSTRLVIDPVSEGGDGLPGFSCPNCASRRRVFDFMRQDHKDPSLYCNAAFVLEEDLEVLQQDGNHCNKTLVGPALTQSHRGFALNENIADEITTFFYLLKYNGVMAKHYKEAKPVGNCKALEPKRSNKRLTIQEMSGIWVATYGFAFVGLVLRAVQRYRESFKKQHKVIWVDQWGNAMPNPKALETLGFDKEDNRSPVEIMLDESQKSQSRNHNGLDGRQLVARLMEQSQDLNKMDH